MSLFAELKRRNVFKVGAAYLIIAWLLAQVLDLVLGTFGTPDWVMKTVLLLLAAGFVLSLLLAWAYELTAEGIRRDSDLVGAASQTRTTGNKLNYLVFGILGLAAAYLFITGEQAGSGSYSDIEAIIARPSVAVLPFANISGDDEYDYLALGITDELIAGLQRHGKFPVVSRNASMSYSLTDVSATDFAQNYGASYLVEGSVNMGSDGVRILVNLSGTGGNQVWAERYELKGGQVDIFDVSDELVSKVAGAVQESEVTRVRRIDRPPSDAWEHYVKGLSVVLAYDAESYAAARQHLDKAVEIAPDMAEAWWALGELEAMKYMTGPPASGDDFGDLHNLIQYFRKAHEISPFHAAACGCLGYMLTAVGRPDEARIVYEQALEAKPLSPDLRIDYAIYLTWSGRYEEALENAALALKLGPVSQDRAGVWTVRSIIALAQGNDKEALDAINRALFVNRDTFYTPTAVAMLYVLGHEDEAAKILSDLRTLFPDLRSKNPVFYVMLKPIDDILAVRREQGKTDDPADVEEIYSILRQRIN